MGLRLTFIRTAVTLIGAAASLIAAASDKDDFEQRADKLRAGPASAPVENETGFGKGLKCMDNLFHAYGVRHVTVVIDQIPDATKKINAGARDMFLSATSQMTRTSHAIRLVPIVDSRVFSDSKRQQVVSEADFAIQGSISQFDDSMLQKQRDGAVCIWKLCIGAADSDKISGMGLDLNLVETTGMSLVPGAAVRNAVLLRKHGNGYDGEMTLKNFAIEYNFTLSSNDGNGQALRTLIELGAIELYGRLLKLPYWSCLGASEQDPEVSAEIDDWWEEMASDPRDRGRLLGYLQVQMKAQGLYTGDINGHASPKLLRAVRAYQLALGMPDGLNLDSRFMHKYLAADHLEVRKVAAIKLAEIDQKDGPLPPEPVAQAAPQGASAGQGAQAAQNTTAGTGAPVAQNTLGAAGVQSGPARAPVAAQVASAPTVAIAPMPTAAAAQPVAPTSVAATQAVAKQTSAQVTQPTSAAGVQKAAYHPPAPVATIPIEGSRPASKDAYRAGEPFFVGVISPHDGYLYCYLIDDRQGVSQFYPTPAQAPTRLTSGTLTVVNSASPLVANHRGHREQVACFSSPKDLGRQPLDAESVRGLEALKTRFAIAVSGTYAMGVFDVNVQ